jgi:hypothetical protein
MILQRSDIDADTFTAGTGWLIKQSGTDSRSEAESSGRATGTPSRRPPRSLSPRLRG